MSVAPVSQSQSGLLAILPGDDEPLGPERVPLTGVRIDVVARGVASAVTVSQRYVNREKVPVEAVYSFPLEEQAAVCGFEALVGEQRIVGRVTEKEAAFDEYDRAMSAGKGAFLLDQDRSNLFTASIGNLQPGQQAVVTVRYVAPLERLGDQVRLKIPTTAAPRYIPEEQLRRMDPSEFDHLNPPAVPGGVPYGLELTVEFEGASRVTSVECPSHPARVSTRGKTARVELSGADVQLDRDVVVTFTMKDAGVSGLYAARDDAGDTILMLDVLPPRDVRRGPVEAVFLIDRSGSMGGSSITQARDALLLALSALQEGDRFNVIGFGSVVMRVFDDPVPYNDQNLAAARSAVQGWDADLGGTEILRPLRQILEGREGTDVREGADAPEGARARAGAAREDAARAPQALPRRLLVLTDGEVANEDECLELVGRRRETAVFTLGVGYGASDYLVRGLARAGGGHAEFVHPGERIEPALMRQMSRLTAAGLVDARVDWGGLPVDLVAPAELPPLYPGTPMTVYARVPAAKAAAAGSPAEVALVATGPDGEVRHAASADLHEAAADAAIPRLFAREAIRDLEEGRDAAASRGSRQRDRREGRVKDAIIELATRHTLMSTYTSFVAVEEREGEAATDEPQAELRRIPVALLEDWHGGAQSTLFTSLMPAPGVAAGPSGPRLASRALGFTSFNRLAPQSVEPYAEPVGASAGLFMEPDAPAGRSALVTLVSAQRADGSWPLDARLFEEFGVPGERLSEVAAGLRASGADDAATATALALFLLERLFAGDEVQWRLAADKAQAWLSRRAPGVGAAVLRSGIERAMAWWTPPDGRGA